MSIAFVFPGQGSQTVGMLQGFAQAQRVNDMMAQADRALGEPLTELIAQGPIETLSLTVNTQPAMLASSVAIYQLWLERGGVKPAMMAGHSLGEYSALTAAGVLNFDEAVRLVRYRATVMQNVVPVGVGGMAALIGLDDAAVLKVCEEARDSGLVTPANFNAPGQVVIAGEVAAVERAIELAKAAGCRRAISLPVSAPFHSPMMKEAGVALLKRLADTPMQEASVPVYRNVDAQLHGNVDAIRQKLSEQVYSSVEWVKIIESMVAAGVTDIVECGPGKVLTGLIKRITPEVKLYNLTDEAALNQALEALA